MSIDLRAAFKNAEGEKKYQQDFELRQMEIAVSQGQLDITQSNLQMNFARAGGARAQLDAKRKMAESTHTFMVLLDQLQNIIDVAERDLQSRYGENYLSAMAERYGIDTEGKSPEGIRKAMIEELQKGKYKDDSTAQKDLAKLLEIDAASEQKAKVNAEYAQKGYVSEESKEESNKLIENSGRGYSFEFGENNLDITMTGAARDRTIEVTKDVRSTHENDINSFKFS